MEIYLLNFVAGHWKLRFIWSTVPTHYIYFPWRVSFIWCTVPFCLV